MPRLETDTMWIVSLVREVKTESRATPFQPAELTGAGKICLQSQVGR